MVLICAWFNPVFRLICSCWFKCFGCCFNFVWALLDDFVVLILVGMLDLQICALLCGGFCVMITCLQELRG